MNSVFNSRTQALILAPHTDDEFGCAGTILRLVESGADIHYFALSDCVASVPEGFPEDVLRHECTRCVTELGVPRGNITVGSLPVRHFPAHRQEILETFVALRKKLKPTLVLLPAGSDMHQDHHTVYEEGFRAFKHSTILGYELPQNTITFQHAAFVVLNDAHVEAKIRAMSEYKSQAFRPYSTADFIKSIARVRGLQAGAEYAEAFELIRWIGPL